MRIISTIFIFLMLSACTSMVNVDYDKNINFRSFTTYNIELVPVRVSGDTRVSSPFMQQRVEREINAELSKKGFESVKKNAELRIKYYLDITREDYITKIKKLEKSDPTVYKKQWKVLNKYCQ